MILWKIDDLVTSIKGGGLTEQSKFYYLLINLVLILIVSELIYYFPIESYNSWDITYSVLSVLVSIIGSYLCYQINGGKLGIDFLGKYFSIGFVISLRALVFFIPVFIALTVYWFLQPVESNESTLVDTLPFILLELFVFWRMYVHIKKTNS